MSAPTPSASQARTFLVTGVPRSGTTYMARLLAALGKDVRHERMGEDGISSWMLATDADTVPWGPSRRGWSFDITMHVVRDPVATIASLQTMEEESWDFMQQNAGIPRDVPLLERATRAWLVWNELAAALRPDIRVQVEHAPEVVPRFLHERGLLEGEADPERFPPTSVNARPHPPLSWETLRRAIPAALGAELDSRAAAYGYSRG